MVAAAPGTLAGAGVVPVPPSVSTGSVRSVVVTTFLSPELEEPKALTPIRTPAIAVAATATRTNSSLRSRRFIVRVGAG
jgi:hypothetical protein